VNEVDDRVPTSTSTAFPRSYLLSIYTAAIEQGFIWITPISAANAVSLRQKLYRLRRRSDKNNASFITPNHHLVTVGDWEAGPDGQGRLPVMFSSSPGGLPNIQLADGTALPPAEALAVEAVPAPAIIPLPLAPDIPAKELNMSAENIDDFVSRMMQDSSARLAEEDDE
jgi:hypothetical protein